MGRPIPERITNAPSLDPSLSIFLGAFYDLSTERRAGFSVLPIPWSAIANYGKVYNFGKDQFEDLIYFVRRLDEAYLDRMRKKKDSENAKNTSRPRKKTR